MTPLNRWHRRASMSKHRAEQESSILEALEAMYPGRSRKSLRSLLGDHRIRLNGEVVVRADSAVQEGDEIECSEFGKPLRAHPKVTILYEDRELLIVEKAADLVTADESGKKMPSVRRILNENAKRRGQRWKAHPCHRLDREVSGVLAFAKSHELAQKVRSDVRRYLAERIYHALVEGTPREAEGRIDTYLLDGDDMVVRPSSESEGGKRAITLYRVLESTESFSVLEVQLETGRKNQIRAHLRAIGNPVAGDAKYGARTDPARRVALHARRLRIVHPTTGDSLTFDSAVPESFARCPVRRRRG